MKSGDVISEEYILYYIFFLRNRQTFEGHELSVERSLVLFDLYFSWISLDGNSPSVILPFQMYFD